MMLSIPLKAYSIHRSRRRIKRTYERIKGIEVIDKHTIRFILSKPSATFLMDMTMGIVPKDIAEKAPGISPAGLLAQAHLHFIKGLRMKG